MLDKNTILELGDKLNDNMNELYKKKIENIIEELDILKKAYRDLREVALELAEECEKLRGSTKGHEKEIAELDIDFSDPESNPQIEHKFKVGDKIRFVGEINESGYTENGIRFSDEMKYLEDREPREILSIDYFNDYDSKVFNVELEDIFGEWIYNEDDFEKVEE